MYEFLQCAVSLLKYYILLLVFLFHCNIDDDVIVTLIVTIIVGYEQ